MTSWPFELKRTTVACRGMVVSLSCLTAPRKPLRPPPIMRGPRDSRLKRILIGLDNRVLNFYDMAKRCLGIPDTLVSWVMAALGGRKRL